MKDSGIYHLSAFIYDLFRMGGFMKRSVVFSLAILLFSVSLSCSQTGIAQTGSTIELVGSTPGDTEIKKMLGIPADIAAETIRWEMALRPDKTFSVDLVYGESKPNTRDLKVEHKLNFVGNYAVSTTVEGNVKRETYSLESDKASLSMIKINDNLFHILTADKKLMGMYGGWSYTLNRKTPIAAAGNSLPVVAAVADEKAAQTIFGGRTPCGEIVKEFKLTVAADCFKIKWKFTLNRDPKTFAPTTYTLQRADLYPKLIEGRWAIKDRSGAKVYQLDPDKPDKTISLLRADENVMYFLDKKERPFVGDKEFSYTIDRKIQ